MSKGKNKQVIKHFDNKDDLLKLNRNRLNLYDNEFASDYEFEDRQLELQRDEINQYTKSKAQKTKKSSNNKTAK